MLCSYDVQRYHTALVQAGGNADGLTEKSKALKGEAAEEKATEKPAKAAPKAKKDAAAEKPAATEKDAN